jgi:hypothetical protein
VVDLSDTSGFVNRIVCFFRVKAQHFVLLWHSWASLLFGIREGSMKQQQKMYFSPPKLLLDKLLNYQVSPDVNTDKTFMPGAS